MFEVGHSLTHDFSQGDFFLHLLIIANLRMHMSVEIWSFTLIEVETMIFASWVRAYDNCMPHTAILQNTFVVLNFAFIRQLDCVSNRKCRRGALWQRSQARVKAGELRLRGMHLKSLLHQDTLHQWILPLSNLYMLCQCNDVQQVLTASCCWVPLLWCTVMIEAHGRLCDDATIWMQLRHKHCNNAWLGL